MSPLIYEKKDGIATLTMNRPEKHNAMNPQMQVEMARAGSTSAMTRTRALPS